MIDDPALRPRSSYPRQQPGEDVAKGSVVWNEEESIERRYTNCCLGDHQVSKRQHNLLTDLHRRVLKSMVTSVP